MTDILLPVSLDIARVKFRVLDSVGVSRNPLNGAVRTAARGGDKLAATIEYAPTGGMSTSAKQRQRILRAHIAQLVRSNRVYLYDPGYVQQGSFPATEVLNDNDFSAGTTTAWNAPSVSQMAVRDGVMRVTATSGAPYQQIYQSHALTQYAPYALRSYMVDGHSGVSTLLAGPALSLGSSQASVYDTSRGYRMISGVNDGAAAGNQYPLVIASTTGFKAGDFWECHWSSLSRCILADSGPNALTYSDQIDNAAWTKSGVTITANADTAPDGTTTAERFAEDTSTGSHYINQSGSRTSVEADMCVYGYFKQVGLDRDVRLVIGNNGTDYSEATFDLSAGGYYNLSNSGTATSGRAFIVSAGNGWYFCCVVSRAATAAATIMGWAQLTTSSGTTSYTGTTGALSAWRVGAAVSSVPVRPVQTTSTATSGTSQSGSTIYVKGGPASASGSLLFGDWVEVTTSLGPQLTMVVSALDFDAAGLGVLRVSPSIRGTVADNAAIIVHQPMGRFLPSQGGEWQNDPGIFTTATAMDFEEAPA